jgi:3-methyl-2-oxobutanoate hydroxymethyltransferase
LKKTVITFKDAKQNGEKLTVLTAYDYPSAKLADLCGIDALLVGDSLGMVCLGYENTLRVTMQDMLHHTKAVSRGTQNALVIADMPFMSYQASVYDAVKNAGSLVQEGGAHAVKLEGGAEVLDAVRAIVKAQIPVMGHVGLTPQSINMFGGFKVQGREREKAGMLVEAVKALEDAGAFAVVLECIPKELAKEITKSVSIPTIGIGAGAYCDGQVLVWHDMLGIYSDIKPKFVKSYANAGEVIKSGISKYINEVREGIFPGDDYSY